MKARRIAVSGPFQCHSNPSLTIGWITRTSVVWLRSARSSAGPRYTATMTSERIPKSAQRTNPYVASADELRAVASAVLEHEKFGQTPAMLPSESEPAEGPGLLVLIDRSTCLAGADSQCGDLLNPWFDSFVSEELRKALAIANTEPQEIDLDGLPGTQVVSA